MGRKFVNALLQTGSQGIMAGELTNLSTDLTSGKIFRLDKAPHDWLFPRMGTVVHHGGAGTTAAAFIAGIPQVVVPFSNDQFAWGKRVEELGVGKCIRPTKNITFKDLIAVISEVQKPNYVNNAKILGEKLSSENGVSRAVAVIEEALQL